MSLYKIAANIGAVQETLLIPLYGRYRVSLKRPDVFFDGAAIELVPHINYDFKKFDKAFGSINGSVIRTLHYDKLVKQFIADNPTGSVIEIGCGLNMRFNRVDNGQVHWLDMDLSDVIEFRKRLEASTSENIFNQESNIRYQCVAADITQPDTWYNEVGALPKPWCFVSEAAIIYLDNKVAQDCLGNISKLVNETHTDEYFGKARLVMDTSATEMVNSQDKHDAMKLMSKDSWFRFKCDDPKQVEQYGSFKLLQAKGFLDLDVSTFKAYSLPWYIVCKYFAFLFRKKMNWYKMCVYKL